MEIEIFSKLESEITIDAIHFKFNRIPLNWEVTGGDIKLSNDQGPLKFSKDLFIGFNIQADKVVLQEIVLDFKCNDSMLSLSMQPFRMSQREILAESEIGLSILDNRKAIGFTVEPMPPKVQFKVEKGE
jgi:hypothetical protein